ncbi:translocation/assembly module TamB domain-containing protein [Sulfitobacter alexandrii]|nr:translocation/assembly module TamB domain-containing protein [Sulfitobacter alexandrii]
MRFLLSFLTAITVLLAVPGDLRAQEGEDDKGFLTRTIQDALSGAGRTVRIDGFRGALSSTASFDRMTIADDEGVWLTLEDVTLDWTRSALLRGRLEVQSLTAARLDLPRLPVPSGEVDLPDAEAQPFSLPELPVAINIADFGVDEINLGAPLLGEAAQLTLQAKAQYTDELLDVDITANRTDAKQGEFAIRANLERTDNVLDLLVRLSEGEEGIVAKLMSLPDQPSVNLTVEGNGPLSDFVTDLNLSTDGQERLAGQITLGTQESGSGSDTPDRRVQGDIGGDVTALFAPRFREFFGENVRLTLDALLESTGAIEVSDFSLDAQAADIAGRVTLNAEKWPTFIDVTGTVANPDGTTILLPVGGEGTTVERVGLRVNYDAADGEALDAAFDIDALQMAGLSIDSTQLGLDGTLRGDVGTLGEFLGDVTFSAEGLALTNPASAEAIGSRITGSANINYVEGQPTRITGLDLTGTDYGLAGDIVIAGLENNFRTELDVRLNADDLSRFSALAGRELDGRSELALNGSVTPLGGMFDLRATGSTENLVLGIPQADAVLEGRTELNMQATRNETGTFLRDLSLRNDALSLTGSAELRTDDSRVQADFRLEDVGLVLPQYDGPVTVSATATQDTRGWVVDAVTDGPYGAALTAQGLATGPNAEITFTADVPDVKPFAEQIEGPVRARGTLSQTPDGWRIRTDATGPYDVTAAVEGLVSPTLDVDFDLSMPQVNPLVPQVSGPLSAQGNLRQTAEGFVIDTTANGPYDVRAAVQGALTPALDIRFDVSVPNVQPVVPQVNGPLNATGTLRQTDDGFVVDTQATGPYGAQVTVAGLATGPNMSLNFNVSVPNVNPLVPSVNGPLSATGKLYQTPDGLAVDTQASGPYSARATVNGVVTGPNADVDFTLAVPNVAALVPQLNGPLNVDGSARRQGSAWQIDTDARGPGGTQATVSGQVAESGNLNLDIAGTAPLGLSRPFLEPRILQGLARFDLTVNGPPALSSLSGTVTTSDAALTAPNLRIALEGIDANIRLGNNRADIDLSANAVGGGRLRVGGGVTLTGSLPADLQVALEGLVLTDPKLYRTSLGGNLRIAGPLAGGAVISGRINVGETNVNVPSTGMTTIGDIPQITHIGADPAVIATRRKAGLTGAEAGTDPAADNPGGGFGLNLEVNAPNRIFVRGRGLDAELGGGLTLTGTTNNIISAGRFELIRGRLDILGRRFNLVEGSVQFQGDLIPYLRFVSSTTTNAGEVRVIVQGPADSPEVLFEATPAAPQDEVLAQLLFGRNIADISAFQALQLASAVATLAGRGGNGVIGNLRDNFGLDDLDVTTTEDGSTAVRAGKYISENVYSDVTAASDGSADISLNIDITPNLTGKATLGSDGNSGIGLFFERDY